MIKSNYHKRNVAWEKDEYGTWFRGFNYRGKFIRFSECDRTEEPDHQRGLPRFWNYMMVDEDRTILVHALPLTKYEPNEVIIGYIEH